MELVRVIFTMPHIANIFYSKYLLSFTHVLWSAISIMHKVSDGNILEYMK